MSLQRVVGLSRTRWDLAIYQSSCLFTMHSLFWGHRGEYMSCLRPEGAHGERDAADVIEFHNSMGARKRSAHHRLWSHGARLK